MLFSSSARFHPGCHTTSRLLRNSLPSDVWTVGKDRHRVCALRPQRHACCAALWNAVPAQLRRRRPLHVEPRMRRKAEVFAGRRDGVVQRPMWVRGVPASPLQMRARYVIYTNTTSWLSTVYLTTTSCLQIVCFLIRL